MNRVTLLLSIALLTVAGCGDEPEPGPEFPPVSVNEPENAAAAVAGVIRFDGTPPPRRVLPAPDAACRHDDRLIRDESVVVEDGRLRDVLVWLEKGAEEWTFEHEREEVLVDQVGCVFIPHVVAVRTFQPVRFQNSDPLLHNINCSTSKEGFARNVTPREQSFVRQFREPEVGKRVICDLHANMLMYVHVLEHPWFAVTGPDGAFALEGVPAGAYTLAARHERLGTQRREIEVGIDGRVTADFTFTMK